MTAAAQMSLFTKQDRKRLSKQLTMVKEFMLSHVGEQVTLAMIHNATGAPEASASARLRDLRKMGREHGWVIETSRVSATRGLYVYRMLLRKRAAENLCEVRSELGGAG